MRQAENLCGIFRSPRKRDSGGRGVVPVRVQDIPFALQAGLRGEWERYRCVFRIFRSPCKRDSGGSGRGTGPCPGYSVRLASGTPGGEGGCRSVARIFGSPRKRDSGGSGRGTCACSGYSVRPASGTPVDSSQSLTRACKGSPACGAILLSETGGDFPRHDPESRLRGERNISASVPPALCLGIGGGIS